MRISKIEINNFRGIFEAEVPLSEHVCAVGPNNSGKSSFLIALSLFLSGNKLSPSDFYDSNEIIVIKGVFEDIKEENLNDLAEEHKSRIREIIFDGKLELVRKYDSTGKSVLNCLRRQPKDLRFKEDEIEKIMAGKKGDGLRTSVIASFPELESKSEGVTTQKAFKELIKDLVKGMSEEQLVLLEAPLPTGIDKSIYAIFPDVIYIPAVIDLTDDVKTKESTSFGKILKVLLELISETDELKEISNSFTKLKGLLNKEIKEDGTVSDVRLPQIKDVEAVVSRLLSNQFPYAKLDFEISPPELKTIFSNAHIFVDDGIRNTIETKGDGMKRAVTFALLRGYVEIKESQKHGNDTKVYDKNESMTKRKYLFLFEEPELYLHPKAQHILYEALGEISKEHQVFVSTHSPYFFGPESTETILRFSKEESTERDRPPYSKISPIDLRSDISKKDAFQILCFENNNAALFCDRVVLCEGDSDLIYFKHLSRTISPKWNFYSMNIGLIQIGGKGNFARYRDFFNCFGVPVQIIGDLDSIVDQYKSLGASSACDKLHSKMIMEVDRLLKKESGESVEISIRNILSITGQKTFKERYNRTKELAEKCAIGEKLTPDELNEFKILFEKEIDYQRRGIISDRAEIKGFKDNLIGTLREEGIHILSKGSLEEYHPEGVEGSDKPSRALSACKKINSREDVFKLCDTVQLGEKMVPEFQAIFGYIFDDKLEINKK